MDVSATVLTPARTDEPGRGNRLIVLGGVGAALVVGLLFATLSYKLALEIVVGVAAAAFFGRLALVKFEGFVLATLVVRSALDSLKVHGAGGVAAGVSSSSGPAGYLGVAVLMAAVLYWFARSSSDQPRERPPSYLRWPLVAFMCAGLASVLNSSVVGTSLNEVLRIAAVVVMLFVLERLMIEDARTVRRILTAVFASAIIPILYAFAQAASGGGRFIGGFSRIQGTFDQPNPFAIYLTFIVVMGAALFRYAQPRLRVPMALVIAGAGICLLLTYTRSAWIATVVGLLIVGLYQNKKLVAGILILIVVAAIAVPSVGKRFSDLGHGQRLSGASGNSLVWRFSYWGELISLADKHPVTGIGLKVIETRTDAAKNAHNDFLRAYVETGAVGLLAYLALIVGLVRTALRALRVTRVGLPRGIAVGFAGALAAFILLSLVSNIISQVVLLWYFFAFAAAATAVAYHEQRWGGLALAEMMEPPAPARTG